MALSNRKITTYQKNIKDLPDNPSSQGVTATQLKNYFDGRTDEEVKASINGICDDLSGTGGAAEIGTDDSSTVQAELDALNTDKHSHSNKALLDTYDQTNANLTDAVSKKHSHSNKGLLDSYTQSNSDISDSVSKKHSHSNKSVLDTYNQTNSDISDAVTKKHNHSNKTLLDSYAQTESDLSDAVSKKHNHSNKELLDTYEQTEVNLSDAVSKKHNHSNKAVLDAITTAPMLEPSSEGTNGQVLATLGNGVRIWVNKQDVLVSGTNIKTINNVSILGSGDMELSVTPFIATFQSTFAEVDAAYKAGKTCYFNGTTEAVIDTPTYYYPLIKTWKNEGETEPTGYVFAGILGNYAEAFSITNSGVWHSNSYTLAETSSLANYLAKPTTAGTSGQVLTSNGSGGQTWETPTGSLPAVTASDNDATLQVVNGAWSKGKKTVTTLGADHTTIPTSKAVADAISSAGGGDMLKATYDANNNGIVDNAEALDGHAASYFATATNLSSHTGDTTVHVTSSEKSTWNGKQDNTNSLTAETALADSDYVPFYDASASANRKTLWSNIKSVLKTYFDTVYAAVSHSHSASDVTSGTFADARIASASTWNGKSSKAVQYTGTLTVAGWSSNAQTLSISGLATSGYVYDIKPAPASFNNYCAAMIYADDISTANSITFHCTTVPTSAITVRILKVQV